MLPQWLKITEKVAFNIASEASYVYILCGQKFIKNDQNWWKIPKFADTKMYRLVQVGAGWCRLVQASTA